jgi:putative phosphoesterase
MLARVSNVSRVTVGVISDTHGLLRPEALAALDGCEHLIHAGDVGSPHILEQLRALAPTTAVRGNVDIASWATALPLTDVVEVGSLQVYVLHDLAALDVDPRAAGFSAVISGHTHRPAADVRNGVLYLNPGSAGPRRFKLPIALARLEVVGDHLSHRIIELVHT